MSKELLAAYSLGASRYDEMLQAPHTPRAHWRPLFEQLATAPPELMRERVQAVRRQVRENGVTYNVYADPQGADRPWELDLLPLILSHEEWDGIREAVAQRALLLDRILADVYGEQSLLKDGSLPPALVLGHANYLHPCRGARVPGDVRLHLYAADLARAPDGRWWVVADRTQAPSGAGYALENRLVISRLFPELFHDLKVEHLAGYFATLRDSLAHWAPRSDSAPLTVLLTPGPHNETHFEHAYLSRYLGFPLVEGSDLTVRDRRVFLKTLSGLQRVHAIVRRLDDDFCDPLELRGDSALGIAGLTDAMRQGNVLLANALGSGLLESGVLLGFLPSIAKRLLGAELKMPSVATWWCGEPAALEQAIAQLKQLVIKPAFPQSRFEPVFGDTLTARGRETLIARMRSRPHDYVAQESVNLSQAPVWDAHHPRRVIPCAIGLRVYACASPNGYAVMPGGLTRVATGANARVVSMQRGGGSKDTWVLSAGPVSTFSLLRRAIGAHELARSGTVLSSRVVENLFWLGRYSERTDAIARLLRIALGRLIDETPGERAQGWASIVELCRRAGLLAAPGERDDIELVRELRAAIVEDGRPGLAATLQQMLRVASQLRERLSLDNWRTLNQMLHGLTRLRAQPLALSDALAELDRVVAAQMTLAGFALDGMTRDSGWRFLSMGRRIERLQWLSTTLQQAIAGPHDDRLEWLLELADSIITYRSRYQARPEWLPVLDLLVRDES
ncbi:MAG TPA: circularly permuted type 2 ATP-grasp protein, partial [Burkholderiales bacterium]|nr:circularly permuted type 2 ATP-grasp protein [Burkholderiales bacterium]